MPDRLEVDLDGLETLASRLDGIRASLQATRRMVDAAAGDPGSADVARALHRFEKHWRDGRERIDDSAETLSAMLHESVRAYRASDQQLADGLRTQTGETVRIGGGPR